MFFTIADHNNNKNQNGFSTIEIDFKDIPNYVLASGYASNSLVDGSRKRNKDNSNPTGVESYNGKENVLILDIDDGVTIEQIQTIFSKYDYIIITTKSHRAMKGGTMQGDRFRVFLKIEMIDEYEVRQTIIGNIYKTFFFIDQACKNANRFFYASPADAIVIVNETNRMFDAMKYSFDTPNTDKHIPTTSKVATNRCESDLNGLFVWNELEDCYINDTSGERDLNTGSGLDDVEVKLLGVRAYLDEHFFQGNKGNCLFNCGCMMKGDYVFTDDEIVDILMAEWEQRKSGKDRYNDALSGIKNSLKYG